MEVFENIPAMKQFVRMKKAEGKTIGFVPTMGYLHSGHLSLIKKSTSQNDVTVISIFVNPTQFGENEDLDQYPRDFERDCRLAQEAGADAVFFPTAGMMYPEGYKTYVEVVDITKRLCGVTRPTHFKGVTTVVTKLFHIVAPDRAYFGQKDAQQLLVIRQMVKDLNMDIEIVGCPIVRETDGLAMSSRNLYLSEEERTQATVLNQSLEMAEKMIDSGERDSNTVKKAIKAKIGTMDLARIDYVELVDTESLLPAQQITGEVLIALAVYFGKTRLIDNRILEVEA